MTAEINSDGEEVRRKDHRRVSRKVWRQWRRLIVAIGIDRQRRCLSIVIGVGWSHRRHR